MENENGRDRGGEVDLLAPLRCDWDSQSHLRGGGDTMKPIRRLVMRRIGR